MRTRAALMSIQALSPALWADLVAVSRAASLVSTVAGAWEDDWAKAPIGSSRARYRRAFICLRLQKLSNVLLFNGERANQSVGFPGSVTGGLMIACPVILSSL